MKRSTLPTIGLCLIVAIIYFVGAELGLSLASLHENVTPGWPPTGIAIALVLVFGPRVLPGVFLGALAANLPTSLPIPFAFGIYGKHAGGAGCVVSFAQIETLAQLVRHRR